MNCISYKIDNSRYRFRYAAFDLFTIGKASDYIPIQYTFSLMICQYLFNSIAIYIPIPRIHEIDIVARRRDDTFVHRVVNTLIGLAYPVSQTIGVFADDICRPVARAAVDHDILDILLGLVEHRQHRLLDTVGRVVTHRHNGTQIGRAHV